MNGPANILFAAAVPSHPDHARCEYLHQLFQEVEEWISGGMPLKKALQRAAKRRRGALFKRGHLSVGSLTRHLYRWRQHKAPEVFQLNYKPGMARVPAALADEFLNRLVSERVLSAATVMHSLRSDWRLGRSIPGLGTWKDYVRRRYGETGCRLTPPRFPHSYRTLLRCLGSKGPSQYGQRIKAALRAQQELNRFFDFVEARRTALASRRRHEPLGNHSAQ